jgi:DNA invertase Pin-like site-specific DNA recombinase
MKVAIYCRVSDDKKKSDGTRRQDVQRQVEKLSEFLKNRDILEFEIYKDDGKSAYTEDFNQRKDFKRLLNDCRRGLIKEIFIEDMTRFSRNLVLGLQWLKELSELGVQVTSLSEGEIEVTSSGGWMKSTIFLMIAEWSSRLHSEKVISGMNKARNLGKKIGGFKGIKVKGGSKPTEITKEIKSVERLALK